MYPAMRRSAIALAVALGAACGSTEPVGGASTTGAYTLRTVNGASLPYASVAATGTKTEVLDAVLNMYQGGTYAETGHVRTTTSGGQVTTTATTETGTFSILGTSITFRTSDGVRQRLATGDGVHITFVENGVTRIYAK